MSRLDGKVAIVTGAARGLGRAYALRLGSLGANVAVVDINPHSYRDYDSEQSQMDGDTTADEVRRFGVDALMLQCDVTDTKRVGEVVQHVADRWARIDVLVCNAGGGSGSLRESQASRLDFSEFDLVVRRNLYGTVNTCVSVAPVMKAQHSGKIITVSSQAGIVPNDRGSYAHYGAAKAGIIMYTKYLAQDLGTYGITANCIAPGYIGTGRLMVTFEQQGVQEVASRVALNRIGTVEDCASVVEFLATELSNYVTGVVIPVDGGVLRVPA
jgi:3-oxoacyl-[acyl-carrier protein] reductase